MTTPNNTVAGLPETLRFMVADSRNMGVNEDTIDLDVIEIAAEVLESAPHQHLRGAHLSGKAKGCLLCDAMEERDSLKAALASPAPSVGGSVALHESGQMADFLNDVSASTDLTLGAARIALSEAAIRFREIAIAPETGSWIAAGDVNRLTREIDVALNGEEGAAMRPMLCDIAGQVCEEARKLGRPLLAAAPSVSPCVGATTGDAYETWCPGCGITISVPSPSVLPAVAGDAGELQGDLEIIAGYLEARGPAMSYSPGIGPARTILIPDAIRQAIHRLATAEQPGSAVQGEPFGHFFRDMSGAEHFRRGPSVPALAQTEITPLYTTPPPAPAAEQGGVRWWTSERLHKAYEPDNYEDAFKGQPEARGVEGMVNRFLCWKLPDDFAPDAGISFTPSPIQSPGNVHWPVGTNLLTAAQARAMFEHCLAAAPSDVRMDDAMVERAVEEIRKAKHTCFDRWTDHQAMRAALTAALAGKERA